MLKSLMIASFKLLMNPAQLLKGKASSNIVNKHTIVYQDGSQGKAWEQLCTIHWRRQVGKLSLPGWESFPSVPLHLEASKRLIRHLQIIPKALGMVPVGLIEKHEQGRKYWTGTFQRGVVLVKVPPCPFLPLFTIRSFEMRYCMNFYLEGHQNE